MTYTYQYAMQLAEKANINGVDAFIRSDEAMDCYNLRDIRTLQEVLMDAYIKTIDKVDEFEFINIKRIADLDEVAIQCITKRRAAR